MAFKVEPKEAMILEKIERRARRRQVMRGVIANSYGPKSPTKKRRKLIGRNGKPRQWKDKKKQYEPIVTGIVMEEYNDKQLHQRTMKKVYETNSKNNSISDAIVRGDDPL